MGELPSELTGLIEEHLPLVRHVVVQVAVRFPRHVDREELARAGALGLVEAARRYDAERGVPFNRFAAQRIRGAILDSVRAADWAPRSIRAVGRELEKVEQRLASDLGRRPSVDETAEALGMSTTELERVRTKMHRAVVLALDYELSGGGDDDVLLADMIPDTSMLEPCAEIEQRELHGYLRDAVSLLPERHRLVTVGYFVEGKTSQELARFLGVTESRISQLRSESLEMLRKGIEAQYADAAPAEPTGRRARREAQYAENIAEASDWTDRVELRSVLELVEG